jgi:polar amino acid transport system substrate-binding protein
MRRWLSIGVLLLTGVACTLTWMPATAQAKTIEEIVKDGTLKVGVIPYGADVIKDPKTGEFSGVFVEAITYICGELNVKCAFQEFTWGTFVAGLQSGQVDLSAAATFATMKRAVAIAFTRPVYFLGVEGVTKKGDTRFNKPEDLNRPDVTIAVTQGTGEHRWVTAYAPKAKIRALTGSDTAQPLLEVVAGHAAVGISDSDAVNKTLEKQPSIQKAFRGQTYNPFPVAWAVRKQDTDLLLFFNTAISELISSGKFKEFAQKYKASWVNLIKD